MAKQINALSLSQYIIKYMSTQNITVNHLKLQKLLYYIDAWHYVFKNQPLISENFEAWQHGPVVRTVWDFYKNESILYNNLPVPTTVSLDVEEEQIQIINDVLDEYGNKTAYYLECLTHEEEPWKKARTTLLKIIDKNHMKQYYASKLEDGNGKATTC